MPQHINGHEGLPLQAHSQLLQWAKNLQLQGKTEKHYNARAGFASKNDVAQ